MLYFSRWKAAAILLTTLLVCACSPFRISFREKTVQSWPTWAQRHLVLGLDLQGGSHILLEVDTNAVRKEKLETLRDDVRRVLRENRLGSPAAATIRGNYGRIPGPRGRRSAARAHQAARTVAAARRHPERDRPALGRRRRCRQRPDPAHSDRAGDRRAHPPVGRAVDPDRRAPRQRARHRRAVDPAPGRRPHPGAGAGPAGSVAAEGTARQDRQARPSAWSIRPTPSSRRCKAACRRIPSCSKSTKAENNQPYVIEKRVVVSGEDLTDAQPGFDQRNGEPIVIFRFNTNGARRFAQVTQENVGKPFAIVLDNEVISAPVIREPILGGSGQISGNFTVAGRERPRHPAARRRAAGAADHHRGAHRRPRPRPGFDREGQARRPTSAPPWSSSSCS